MKRNTSKVRILIYAKPTMENFSFFNNVHWARMACELHRTLSHSNFASLSIVASEYQLQFFPKDMRKDLILLRDDFFDLFPNKFNSDIVTNDKSDNIGLHQVVADFLASKLAGEEYDLVFSLADKALPLRLALPNTPIITLVESYFTRHPFPNLWNIDLYGLDDTDTMNVMNESICQTDQNVAETNFINEFKQRYRSLLIGSDPIKTPEGHTTLLPLQHQHVSAVELYSKFSSQMELLIHVLDSTVESSSIFVTEHPQYPELSKSSWQWLRSNYPNFHFQLEHFPLEGFSQKLIGTCDACLCQTSTTGIQAAAIWDLPVYMLSGQNRVTPFSVGAFEAKTNIDVPLSRKHVSKFERQLLFTIKSLSHFRQDLNNPHYLRRLVQTILNGGSKAAIYQNIANSRDWSKKHIEHIDSITSFALHRRELKQLIHLNSTPISIIATYESSDRWIDRILGIGNAFIKPIMRVYSALKRRFLVVE